MVWATFWAIFDDLIRSPCCQVGHKLSLVDFATTTKSLLRKKYVSAKQADTLQTIGYVLTILYVVKQLDSLDFKKLI
jgi:hypothetical protein